jgi:hypothetical protein
MEESEDFIVRFDDDDEHDMAATSGGSSASTTAVTLALRRKLAEQEREMQVRSPPVSACRVLMPPGCCRGCSRVRVRMRTSTRCLRTRRYCIDVVACCWVALAHLTTPLPSTSAQPERERG